MGKGLEAGGSRKTRRLPLDKSNIYTVFETGMLCTSPSWLESPAPSLSSLKPELLRRPVNSQEEVQEAPGTAGVTQQEGEVAAGSCRRPQWLLRGLDQGLLWRQVPGEPHLGFHSRWLARGQMHTLLPRNHSRVAGRAGVLA